MQKIIQQKSKWYWLNLMVERELVPQEKAIRLKRDLASGAMVHNPIVGLVSKIKLEDLLKTRIIVKTEKGFAIPTEETIKNGKKITTVSKKYSEWYNRQKAMQCADRHRQEELNSLMEQKKVSEEVDKLFPGSEVVN